MSLSVLSKDHLCPTNTKQTCPDMIHSQKLMDPVFEVTLPLILCPCSLPPEKPRGTLNKIRDLSKDLTKGLRKDISSSSSTVIKPRNSSSLFGERKPMSSLNGGSHPSINSSTRSLNRTTPTPSSSSRAAAHDDTRRGLATLGSRTTENNARNANSSSTSSALNQRYNTNRPTSSKENLSRYDPYSQNTHICSLGPALVPHVAR